MDHKVCSACKAAHFEEWDLCLWCSSQRQYELERRLREDDGALPLPTVVTAIFGPQRRVERAWRIG